MSTTLSRRSLIAVVAAAPVLAACNRGSSGDGQKVTLALSTLNNPFFVAVRDGAQAAAKEAGIDLMVVDAQNDSSQQGNQMQTAATNGSRAVIINPVDSDAAAKAVAPVEKGDIPIVAVDRAITGKKPKSFVSSDNVAGGKQAAEALSEAIGGKGKVLVLEGIPGASATRDRGKGFKDAIAGMSGIQIVASQTANFDRAQGLNVTSNLLQANSDVVGIYAHNDEMALGAIQALGAKAGKQVKVVGFDGTTEGLAAVKKGTMAATIAQQPKELGKKAVEAVAKILEGKDVSATEDVPVKTVTKDNVADFEG